MGVECIEQRCFIANVFFFLVGPLVGGMIDFFPFFFQHEATLNDFTDLSRSLDTPYVADVE